MAGFAAEIADWPREIEDWQWSARFCYQVIERRGTGGGNFRLMYSRFLAETGRDEAAIFTFDTQLDEIQPFTTDSQVLPDKLSAIQPFGATSLHDAIARTAERLVGREDRRRAVVVFTDGNDNWSRLSPADVSGIAAAIEVPVPGRPGCAADRENNRGTPSWLIILKADNPKPRDRAAVLLI